MEFVPSTESKWSPRTMSVLIGVVLAAIIGVVIYLIARKSKTPKKEQMSGPTHVLFYLDTCSHCHSVIPIWDKLIAEMKGNQVVKYEARKNFEWAKDYGIGGVPDIRYYPNGMGSSAKYVSFEGDRTYDRLKAFIVSGLSK
uniref:Thioredoxin domain-containing protein n=1 Tax=viral metagenome TaxID=1070528 RepID=A0A6C0LX81_9ZZZZ